jgi:DNA-binding NarL/FixJ family response regulator
MQDAQALVMLEIAYNLAHSTHGAMRRIARAVRSAIPRGPVAVAYFDSNGQIVPGSVKFERADEDYISRFFEWQRLVPVALRQLALATTSRVIGLSGVDQHLLPELEIMVRQVSSMYVMANIGDGRGIHILLGHPHAREWPTGQPRYFHEIAQHLAIAWRLRTGLGVADLRAALSVDPDAPTPVARDVLRCAMVARERSRAGQPAAGNQRLWQAILAGQWSLLDVFTAAQTRYIVAYRNPAGGMMLRALPARERSVLELTLAGHSGKWISLELKLCESTAARALRLALRRVGVTDTAGLVGVRNAEFEPIEGLVAGVELAVARLPAIAAAPTLSDAERAIVTEIVGGKRVAAIARERGTSPRTVSNQLASVYRKLGVCSRREVLALLA